MEITLYKRKFNVTNKDRVLDNGSCYQLLTQRYFHDWCYICPVMSKTLFNKLRKEGKLVLSKEKWNGFDLYEFVEMEEGE